MGFRLARIMRSIKKKNAAKQSAAATQNNAADQKIPVQQVNQSAVNQTANTTPAASNSQDNGLQAAVQTTNAPAEEKDGLAFYINSMRNRRKKGAPLIGISQMLGGNEILGV